MRAEGGGLTRNKGQKSRHTVPLNKSLQTQIVNYCNAVLEICNLNFVKSLRMINGRDLQKPPAKQLCCWIHFGLKYWFGSYLVLVYFTWEYILYPPPPSPGFLTVVQESCRTSYDSNLVECYFLNLYA
jgi:hypothetical protein